MSVVSKLSPSMYDGLAEHVHLSKFQKQAESNENLSSERDAAVFISGFC